MIRKKIYRWHRSLSIIIAIPVLFWAISGFMHPVMTNIRPAVATQKLPSAGFDTGQIKVSLQQCLLQGNIDSFRNIHIVQMGGQQFYQVIVDQHNFDIRYFSTKTGKELNNGDKLYARYLAMSFLETDVPGKEMKHESGGGAMSVHDCCLMATMNIMGSKGAKIKSVTRVTDFAGEYKYINRMLPVYKVSFNRGDGIRIYVETASSKFAYAVDNKRAAFDRFFGLFHTWEWMNIAGDAKLVLMVVITLAAFITTLMGLYIFFTTKTKNSNNALVKTRRYHRYTSLVASLFTLMFTFSGGFHALEKVLPKDNLADYVPQIFTASSVNPDWTRLDSVMHLSDVANLSLVRMNNAVYWRMQTEYVDANSYTILKDGDEQYAKQLAGFYSGNTPEKIQSVTQVEKFSEEYGFINKRLPVWKVDYAVNDNERYYIETSTGILATRVQDKDLIEGYSFALLHKHHFMDWGGKGLRDTTTMLAAALQIAMVSVGLLLYFRYRRSKKK